MQLRVGYEYVSRIYDLLHPHFATASYFLVWFIIVVAHCALKFIAFYCSAKWRRPTLLNYRSRCTVVHPLHTVPRVDASIYVVITDKSCKLRRESSVLKRRKVNEAKMNKNDIYEFLWRCLRLLNVLNSVITGRIVWIRVNYHYYLKYGKYR